MGQTGYDNIQDQVSQWHHGIQHSSAQAWLLSAVRGHI